jgi:hypothetical protein
MKARWRMVCECCKSPIIVGEQFTMLHGRPWKTAHALPYQAKRRLITGKR